MLPVPTSKLQFGGRPSGGKTSGLKKTSDHSGQELSSWHALLEAVCTDTWRSWTDDECAAFEERWAPGTMQRRAYAIALYTGQRKADQVAMTRAHRSDGVIQVKQEKTNEALWIAEHRALAAELALGEQGHMSLLTTTKGKAFDAVYFGVWFAEAIDDAGLPDDCVLHGLRKCAARKLADAGCSENEIMSVTRHRTGAIVAFYIKDANKKRAAKAAITKLENKP